MEKSEKVVLLSTIVLVGFVIAVMFHYICGFYFHVTGAQNSFLYPAKMAFCDFFGTFPYIKDLKPYKEISMWIVYFPLPYFFLYPFTKIADKLVAYTIYLSGFVAYLSYMNFRIFNCKNLTKIQNFQNIFILTFVSYPVLYCLDKGNFDIYLFVMMGLWAYAFKDKKYGLSAVILAIMNACKPFTVFFLLFYLFKKQYKNFVLSSLITVILVFGGFCLIQESFLTQFSFLTKSVAFYKYVYTSGTNVRYAFCSSIFVPAKLLFLHFSTNLEAVKNFVTYYDYSCHLITLITLYFVWKEQVFWKQLTLLITNFLMLPYCTYDYKLIFLYIPLWLFICETKKSKMDIIYLILFGLLFVPKNIILYFPMIKSPILSWTSFSAIVNPLILLVLTLIIIFEQIIIKKNK